MMSCWHSGVKQKLWNSRAAFGLRRRLEHAVRPDDQRRAFGGVDRLDRLAGFLFWKIMYSLPSACTARSPSASFFGGSAADCTCMMFCWASFSK